MKAPITRDELKRRMLECGGISQDDAENLAVIELLNEIDRLHTKPKPQPQGKTVRVKVAVAVSSNGEWTAAGWHDGERDVVVETAMDAAFFPANIYWLTADLPIPEETIVEAEVSS